MGLGRGRHLRHEGEERGGSEGCGRGVTQRPALEGHRVLGRVTTAAWCACLLNPNPNPDLNPNPNPNPNPYPNPSPNPNPNPNPDPDPDPNQEPEDGVSGYASTSEEDKAEEEAEALLPASLA